MTEQAKASNKMPTPKTAPKTKTPKKSNTRSAIADVVAREYTINLHRRVRFLLPQACMNCYIKSELWPWDV